MPTYGGTPVLTEAKAKETEAMIRKWLAGRGHTPTDGAVYEPGHEGPMWVFSLEGDYDWPLYICEELRDQWPDGVFVEPVTGWCLGLYPA